MTHEKKFKVSISGTEGKSQGVSGMEMEMWFPVRTAAES